MAGPRSTREGVLLDLMEAFRASGFDGVSLSRISEITGLGKASLYHHFPGGKNEMAEAVMELAGQWLEAHVFGAMEAEGDPAARLESVLKALESFYHQGRKACLLDVMPIGGSAEVKAATKALMQRLLAGFRKLAMDAGVPKAEAKFRAEAALIGIEGSLVLARGLSEHAPFQRQIQALREGFLAA